MNFENLIQQPESLRDETWEKHFLDGIIPRRVEVDSPDPKPGPDGWPYLRVRAGATEGGEPFHRIVTWLAGRGIGLVVNAHKMMPDYVFTYGMIWNYVETGLFVAPAAAAPKGPVELGGTGVLFGEPTPKYFPAYARGVLREFLNAQGFADPHVLVVTTADFTQTDLIFVTETLNNIPTAQHATMAEVLHWFLPQHYNIVLAPREGLPTTFPL